MANERIGSALPFRGAGANYIEKIDTTGKQLIAADSGKTFLCHQNASAICLVNLPSISESIAGWNAKFILATASDYAFEIAPYGGSAGGGTTAQDDLMHVQRAGGPLVGSATHNLGSLADAAGESFDITVTGADLGDLVVVSCLLDVQEMTVTGNVRAASTVEVHVQNESGGTLDIASTTFYAGVWSSNVGAQSQDTVRFTAEAVHREMIDIFCDGTNWYAHCIGAGEGSAGQG